jgi:hypothetical protein
MKRIFTIVLFSYICLAGYTQIDTISCNLFQDSCKIGIGISNPKEKLHMLKGNFLIQSGDETAIIMKRDITFSSKPSGTSKNPIFHLGRINSGGDGDPEFRFLYKDDLLKSEIPVLEFDRKGIVASVKPAFPDSQRIGSHFEGFYSGAEYPYFRLNSYPRMRLEMGEGGIKDVDVAIERRSTKTLGFYTGKVCQVVIDQSGNMGIGTEAPTSKLEIANGDIFISDIESGIIMKSPDEKCWRGTLNNSGVLKFALMEECPKITSSTFQELKSAEEIFFYPNPTDGKITIVTKDFNQKDLSFIVYGLTGEILNSGKITSNFKTLDISQYNSGTYLLSVNDRNGAILASGKIILK